MPTWPVINIRVPPELKGKVESEAAYTDESVSLAVRKLIEDGFRYREARGEGRVLLRSQVREGVE